MSFESPIWLLGLLVIALCAGFAAKSVNSVIAAKYLLESEAPRRAPTPEAEAAAPAAQKSKVGAPIADRNMFCSTCQPVAPTAALTGPIPIRASAACVPTRIIGMPTKCVAMLRLSRWYSAYEARRSTRDFTSPPYRISSAIRATSPRST